MSYSVTTLLNDISGVVHGTTTNKIPNIYGAINRAARAVLLDVDAKETQRIVQLPQVFNSVFDYPLPVDVKGDRIIDLRPQAGRMPADVFVQDYAMNFDTQKSMNLSNAIYTQWNTGLKTIRIEASSLPAPFVMSDTSSLTGWSVGGGLSNLGLDTNNNVAGGGALTFDLTAGPTSGYVETSTLNPLDLSSQALIAYLFSWHYMQTASGITNVNIRWGSSASDYYSQDATITQQSTAFQNGWNLLSDSWQSATVVGTPDDTVISYLRITYTYDGTTQTGNKFCALTANMGYYMDLQYYSKYLFRDPNTNVFQETVDSVLDNTKIINLDTDSYNLLFNKVAYYVAQQLQGADASYDADYWQTEYDNALKRYRALNPAETILKTESYYEMPKNGWSRYRPGFWRF